MGLTDGMTTESGSAWWIIILFLFVFLGWGKNGMNGEAGAANNYVLASDFATLQRMISDGNNMIERKLDNQNSGICDLGYTQAQLINGLGTQMQNCCCNLRESISGLNYNMAMNDNALQKTISDGFCQTNFNNQTNTRDIVDVQNANTRAILDAIQTNKVEALQEKIAEQNQRISALQLAASQQAQNNYIVNQLAPKLPVAAYNVPNPFTGCGCNC